MILSRKTKLKFLAKGIILTAIATEGITHMPFSKIVTAYASTDSVSVSSENVQFMQNNALLANDQVYNIKNSTDKNMDYIYNKIYTGLKNHQDTIEFSADEISQYNIIKNTETDPKNVFIHVVTECPDIYFAPTRGLETFGSEVCLYVSYIYNEDEIAQLDKELEAEADRILKKFDGYSNIRKVYEIHDYIANKCTYDDAMADAPMPKSSLSYTNFEAYLEDNTKVLRENRDYFNSHNAYGALIGGQAVCEGYSKAFMYLLNKAGIDAGIICSDNHAWSYVNIDGQYYQVDLTWDDDDDFLTSTPYKLFATTTEVMDKKHDTDIIADTNPEYIPDCSDSKFDNFLRTTGNNGFIFANNIYRSNNKLYELNTTEKAIYSYDLDGENKEKFKDLSQYAYVESLKADDENIYFITGDNISKFNFDLKKININTGTVSNIVNIMDWFNLDGSVYPYVEYSIIGNKLTATCNDFTTEETKTMVLNSDLETQNLTNATNAVEKVETSLLREDYNTALNLVEVLNDSADKTSLQNRLVNVLAKIEANEQTQSNAEKLTNATKTVEKAETSLIRDDYNTALSLVEALTDGADKTALENRLVNVLTKIEANEQTESDAERLTNATKTVEKAETSLIRDDYNTALSLVEALSDSADKTALENRLANVLAQIEANEQTESDAEKLIKATKAVEKAETSLTRDDYDSALNLVESLTDSADKTSLESRLAKVLTKIKANEQSSTGNNSSNDTDNEDSSNSNSVNSDNNDSSTDSNNSSSNNTNTNTNSNSNSNSNSSSSSSSSSSNSDDDEYDEAYDALEEFKDKLTKSKYKKAKELIYDLDDSDERDELIEKLKKYKKKMDKKYDDDDDDEDYYDVKEESNTMGNNISMPLAGVQMPYANISNSVGWVHDSVTGKWQYHNSAGLQKGWMEFDGQKYLFDTNGDMMTGWIYNSFNGKWYYLNTSSDGVEGQLRTGWIKINGKWYYLDPNRGGAMVSNDYIDGYYLGSDGAWI